MCLSSLLVSFIATDCCMFVSAGDRIYERMVMYATCLFQSPPKIFVAKVSYQIDKPIPYLGGRSWKRLKKIRVSIRYVEKDIKTARHKLAELFGVRVA